MDRNRERSVSGNVYLGEWQNCKVAIKITNNRCKKDCIKNTIKEAEMFDKCSNHPYVCRFLGVVFDKERQSMWLITKYYQHGSLKQYIKNKIN
eukprot:UN23842